eukprot:gnl/MRDRNA2_/MRDRNA2_300002_c0_seq1.p1 gnl/MRDRNA2_/MRDRNA2_300002_c0~~gnl/MRDRNA2_/MRDRNA2_300002_c0_seq1.p1  ORF type:complete len:158 (-),score=24.32 gnl/MRDRNA2_/MRDRNA2_300002_c0_seq1:94-567(-)
MTQATREQQLTICAEGLAPFSDALLVGDFNFDSERNFLPPHKPLHNDALQRLGPEFVDVWAALRSDRGFTFDGGSNPHVKNKREQMRYDRVLARVRNWRCKRIDVVCKEKTNPRANMLALLPSMRSNYVDLDTLLFEDVQISDHYGLISVLEPNTAV